MITVIGGEELHDLFPEELVPVVLALILETWLSARSSLSSSAELREVPITAWFCVKLRQAKKLRKLPFQIRYENHLLETTNEALATQGVVERGRIDLCFSPAHTEDEENFLGFECKRLNVRTSSGLKTLAGEYVKEGMLRFFDEHEYGRGQFHGGMLGYVMDGRIQEAAQAIEEQAIGHRVALRLRTPPCPPALWPSEFLRGQKEAQQTSHERNGQSFTLHHLFLALPPPASSFSSS
jgi:hypothetical protein